MKQTKKPAHQQEDQKQKPAEKIPFIHKSEAAKLLYAAEKKASYIALGGVASVFLGVAISGSLIYMVAALGGVVFSYLFVVSSQKMNSLNQKYELGYKPIYLPGAAGRKVDEVKTN